MSGNARLNWAEARERLLRVQQAIEETTHHSGEKREQIYRARAELLARPVSHREDSAAERIMIVRIGGARYGIALPEISEVTAGSMYAPVPGAPPEVAGLIQIRGEVRPVLNVGRILGVPDVPVVPEGGVSDKGVPDKGVSDKGVSDKGVSDKGVSDKGVSDHDRGDSKIILLLRRGSREIGVQVDEVEDIRTIGQEERKPPFRGAAHARWMTGDLVTVLDTSSLLEEHAEVS